MAFVLSSSSHVLTNKTITPHRIPTPKLPTSQLPSIASVRPPLPPLRRDSALDGVLHKNAGAGGSNDGDDGGKNEFYLNLGLAVRTLRQDMPEIFTTDLNYEIYRYGVGHLLILGFFFVYFCPLYGFILWYVNFDDCLWIMIRLFVQDKGFIVIDFWIFDIFHYGWYCIGMISHLWIHVIHSEGSRTTG